MIKGRALVVDDEADILDLIRITLGRMGLDCTCAGDLAEARRLLASRPFDLCLTDMRLPDGSGIDLVREIGETRPHLPVAMITAHGNMESAVAAMKAGAFDFVAKPLDLQVLRRLVESALRLGPSAERPAEGASDERSRVLGDSPPMQTLRRMIAKLARNQAPVFITGESGTGKELAARLIHSLGPRAGRPFVPVNCGAIPHDLVESELFGHRKGAFTGAVGDKEGLFQAADGGTLFLDEIADLPLGMQVKLLRAIQERAVRPVGAHAEQAVDVRILSASHRDLAQVVADGKFRQDLFYRINVITLAVPPLRERTEDIAQLAAHILARLAEREGAPPRALTPEALDALRRYPFPGNVRELENLLERACALCDGQHIGAEDLYLPANGASPAAPHPTDAPLPLADYLQEVERRAILAAIGTAGSDLDTAARELGISPRSLRYRMSQLGIPSDPQAPAR
ncbi:MAG: sigma-54 dependent transcriptional regulator [Chromatiaceae bacterium]|jgi:two-component system response regulator PilR (NtrC family)|nr:sigma-54 dependent transcriptional regulator [Chromatiaceae bacterium]